MLARPGLLILILAPAALLTTAVRTQPIPLISPPIVARPLPPPSQVVAEVPVIELPPPVTKALLSGHWQLEGARYVWVPPETHLRPIQLRPLLLGENVWKDGKWVYVPTHYAGQ